MKTILLNIKESFLSPKSRKKNIENLVIFLVGIVIVIIAGGYLFGDKEDTKSTGSEDIFNETKYEEKLATILSKIENAGKVDVMVSYQTGIETVPLLDTKDNNIVTEENNSGNTRKTEQTSAETNIIFNQEKSGNKVPYISKKIMPKVEGVIVACDGGKNEIVKGNIVKAVCAVTGIPAEKIQVFPRTTKR